MPTASTLRRQTPMGGSGPRQRRAPSILQRTSTSKAIPIGLQQLLSSTVVDLLIRSKDVDILDIFVQKSQRRMRGEMDTTSEHTRINPQEFWSKFVQPRIAHIQSLSPFSSTECVRHARRTLNDELAAMDAAMCALRSHLNALSPVSNLPAEVLVHIFKLVAQAMTPESWFQNEWPGLGWIRIMTHVCRHWRDTAVLYPSLWSDVHHSLTPQWRKLMISRAQSLPLTLDMQSCGREESVLVAEHAFHIRKLLFSARHGAVKGAYKEFTSSADILERLVLRVSDPPTGRSIGNAVLPTDIFAGHAPFLRRVTLDRVFPSWGAPVLRNLTHLQVSLSIGASALLESHYAQLNRTDPTSQYDHLLNALTSMSALKILELIHCIPSRPLHAAERLPIILPCLELMSLADTLESCVDIIQHLTIPASSRFVLKCTADPHPIDGLVHFFDRHANGRDMPPLLTLFVSHLHLYGTECHIIDLWRTRGPSISSETRMGCRPEEQPFIRIELPSSPDPLEQLEQLGGVLRLEDLRTLKIVTDSDSAWLAETWIGVFGRCRRVEHLSVQGWNGMYLCKALSLSADGAASTDEGSFPAGQQLFFPRLRSLEICTADLLSDPEGTGRPWISSLKSWLTTRADILNAGLGRSEDFSVDNFDEDGTDKDVGNDGSSSKVAEESQDTSQDTIMSHGDVVGHIDNRLKRLLITDCSVMAKHVKQLEPVVQELVWDRCEGIWESASEDDNNYVI